MKKYFLWQVVLILTLSILLAACNFSHQSDRRGEKPHESDIITPGTKVIDVKKDAVSSRDMLTIRMSSDPGTLSPIGTSSYALEILSLVSMPLLWPTDPAGKGDSLVWSINSKALLESYAWSEDNLTLSLKIKEGVLFSNGDEVKANDVVFSMQTIYAGFTNTDVMDVSKITATGEYTVDIPLVKPNISLVSSLGLYYTFSERAYKACANPEEFLASSSLVSCGPFKVVDWRPGDYVLLEKNDKYVNGPPKIKNVKIRFISEKSVATMELQSGGVDVVEEPLWEDFKLIANGGDKNIRGWQSAGLYLTEIGFNATSMFSDYRVRKAFCLSLDKQKIYDGGWSGYGLNAYSVMGSAYDGTEDYSAKWPLKTNVEDAKKLLSDAGYPEGFKCRVIYNGDSNQELALQIIKNQLSEINVDLEIQAFDSATYKSMMANETDTWDLWVRKWGGTGNPGMLISKTYSSLMHFEKAEGGQEVIDYGRRMTEALTEDDYQKIYGEFQDVFWEKYLFWYPLQMQSYITLYRGDLKAAARIYVFFDFDNAYFE